MSLPRLSRGDRLLWSVVLVATAMTALVTWLLLPPEKTGGIVERPSTFYNVGFGTKAAYLALDRLGYPVKRLRRPISEETLAGIGILFILKPSVGLQDYEMKELEGWVRQGHVLVVVPGRSELRIAEKRGRAATPPEAPEPSGPSQRSRRSELRRRLGTAFEDWFGVGRAAAGREQRPAAHAGDSAGVDQSASGVELDASDPLGAGIRHLVPGSDVRFAKPALRGPLANAPAKTFWKDEQGTFGLRVIDGDGAIVALADAYPFSNLGIGEADNGLLLGNIVRELSRLSPGDIAFDEYHLGFPERDWSPVAMAKLMLSGPWRWAAAQALVIAVLALYAGAVRFGSPRDITRKPRRQHREFAEAAGRLLDEGRATSLAAETLSRYYRDRLCRALQLESEADNARLSQAALARSGQDIARLLAQAQGAATRRVGRQELLTIAQGLHRVVEAIDHGS